MGCLKIDIEKQNYPSLKLAYSNLNLNQKSDAGDYRFGFNGKENDKEWGTSNIQDYGFRLYNPALGKFLSVDPLSADFPWNSTYAFAENDVIRCIDLEGAEKLDVKDASISATEVDIVAEDYGGISTGLELTFSTAMNRKVKIYLVTRFTPEMDTYLVKGEDNRGRIRDKDQADYLTNCWSETFISGKLRNNSVLLRSILEDLNKVRDENVNLFDLSVAFQMTQSAAEVILEDNYTKIDYSDAGIGSVAAFYDEEGLFHTIEVVDVNEDGEFVYSSNYFANQGNGSLEVGTWDQLQDQVSIGFTPQKEGVKWFNPNKENSEGDGSTF